MIKKLLDIIRWIISNIPVVKQVFDLIKQIAEIIKELIELLQSDKEVKDK